MMIGQCNRTILKLTALAICTAALAGCVGMKLTAEGAKVTQANPADVGACTLVGKVTSNIPSKTLNRLSPGKVQEQLIVLARNEAPGLGGDTVAPAGPVVGGAQEFNVFRCR